MTENIFLQKYLAEKLTLKKSAGSPERISSTLAKSSIQLNPYQIHAVKFAFDSPLQRGAILADEVGLGKTIEAGIIIAQLWSEGKRKILIIVPASIRRQWQEELFIRFGLESIVIDTFTFQKILTEQNKIPFTYEGIFIISYQFCYKNLDLIRKQNWNCVIIDEAHRLRNVWRGKDSAKIAWSIREAFKNAPKLLLTATPLQNNLMELYGIVSFIDDKLLGTPYSFKKKFVEPLTQNVNPNSAKLIQELRRLIKGEESKDSNKVSGVLVRTLRKQVSECVKFTNRKAFTQDFTPTEEEQELYEKVSAYLQRDKIAAIQSSQKHLMLLVYRKILASSSFAIANTLKRLIEYLEEELKRRKYYKNESLYQTETKENKSDEFLEELDVENFEEEKIKPRIDVELFSDEEIRKEIEELKSYYNLAVSIKKNAKGEALVKALHSVFKIAQEKNWPKKAVIFTESVRTQQYLKELLTQNGFKCTIFNGSNNSKETHQALRKWEKAFPELAERGTYQINVRQALVYEFETQTDVFIATEAGAEGLNLQFCNIVINYDLPWNPQRVEQRIGRCHRYGQKYDVLVVNFLNTKNRADQRVLELLQNKLHLFEGLFGASDEVLGLLESGIDFEKRILEIYQTCRTPEEIDKAFDELQRQIQDRLKEEIKTLRSQILEYLDEPVRQLFKETAFETEKYLSEFDRDLLRLCKYFYGNELVPLNEEDKTYKFKDHIVSFRNLKDEEIGKISRVNKDHPLAKRAIEESLKLTTSPIPMNHFLYTSSGKKYSLLDPLIGKEGLIYLFKLKILGIEEEDILAPFVFIKEKDKFTPYSLEVGEQILSLEAVQQPEFLYSSPIDKETLFKVWNEWKTQILQKYQRRNERLYDREIDRINRYYKDYSLQVDDKIKKLEEEQRNLERRRANSIDLEERRTLHKRIQEIELTLDKLRLEQIKLKEEAIRLKQKEYQELEKKFILKTEEKLIAITYFKIV